MSRRRELEMLLLSMFAAVPLYFTQTIGAGPLIAFHLVMAAIIARVTSGRSPEVVPALIMRGLAIAYVVFYVIDAAVISRSAIAASTHLVLFIAAYQAMDPAYRNNNAQRLLTAGLIFVASLATATHITVVLFVVAFSFLMFRQMMYLSHLETARLLSREPVPLSASRAAGFYLSGTMMIGAVLFPMLPRLRNPVVQGFAGNLQGATTGLSDSINFNEARTSTPDPGVVARVWMGPQAVPFFTPLRLRATVYDAFRDNQWLQTRNMFREVRSRRGVFQFSRPVGFTQTIAVQQRLIRTSRLFLPAGTFAVAGVPQLYEGPTHDAYQTMQGRGEIVNYQAVVARSTEPLRPVNAKVVAYPVTPPVAALARQIVGNRTQPDEQAAAIEIYLSRTYKYVQRPEEIGARVMNTDDFLLRVKRGHCEYFAAGMVALMSSFNVPARIVGGFYGGRMNPLTGYFVLRNEDAHAWVEVWDGARWLTYDPTPSSLRPGDSQTGLRLYATALSDSINYWWDRYVLTYGLGDQIALFGDMISRVRQFAIDTRRNASAFARLAASPRVAGAFAIVLAIVVVILMMAARRRPIFSLIARRLRELGVEVSPSTTAQEALEMLRARDPEAAAAFEKIVALYEEEQFSPRQDPRRIAAIREALAR